MRLDERQARMRNTERETRMYNLTVTGRKEVMNYAWESVASIRITVSSWLPCGAPNLLKPFEIIFQPYRSIYEAICIFLLHDNRFLFRWNFSYTVNVVLTL